jgi:hypothetical protein
MILPISVFLKQRLAEHQNPWPVQLANPALKIGPLLILKEMAVFPPLATL